MGGDSSGGGFRVNGQTYETMLRNSRRNPQTCKTCKGPNTIVEDMLQDVERKVPRFAETLRSVLQKKWYFVPAKLDKMPKAKAGIPMTYSQGAIQYQDKVLVEAQPFDQGSKEDRATMISHELVRGAQLAMEKEHPGYHSDPSVVYDLTVDLLDKSLSAEELRDKLFASGFGMHATAREREKMRAEILAQKRKMQAACASGESPTAVVNAFDMGVGNTQYGLDFLDVYQEEIGVYDANRAIGFAKVADALNHTDQNVLHSAQKLCGGIGAPLNDAGPEVSRSAEKKSAPKAGNVFRENGKTGSDASAE
jgi:hypothetical protein